METAIAATFQDRSVDPLLPAGEVERRLGLADGFLASRRANRSGPRFFKLGRRTVRYRVRDVAAWLEECAR